jgi:SAM-dependent methyltransferase
MDGLIKFWNTANERYIAKKQDGWHPPVDNWLDKYLGFLSENATILELGCGLGATTKYLYDKSFNIIATDISDTALEFTKSIVDNKIKTVQMDLQTTFPFEDNSFEVIVADLCLHYFDELTTTRIMHEIKRVLIPNGTLIARVNSKQNLSFGKGKKLGDSYYHVDGFNKRFFNKTDAQKFFGVIGEIKTSEADMTRGIAPKKTVEILARKV